MSDQGERAARWTATHEDTADAALEEAPTGPMSQINGTGPGTAAAAGAEALQEQPEPAPFQVTFPEVEIPAPEGRTEFSTPDPAGQDDLSPQDLEVTETRPVWSDSWSENWSEPAPADDWRPAPGLQGGEAGAEFPPPPAGSWFEPARRENPFEPGGPEVPEGPEVAPETPEPEAEGPSGFPDAFAMPKPVADPDDVRVAPVLDEPGAAARDPQEFQGPQPAEPAGDDLTFDGIADGPGDPNYAPVLPSGPSTPPKPGKPSSGNWRMPDWIGDEEAAAREEKRRGEPSEPEGTAAEPAARGRRDRPSPAGYAERKSRRGLFAGVGVLALALIVAAVVVVTKGGGDPAGEPPSGPQAGGPAGAGRQQAPQVQLPPDAPLPNFPGTPTKPLGRVGDAHSGLSYVQFRPPWQLPTRKNKLGTKGWSGQQVLVTERRGNRIWYGQLLTGTLHPSLTAAYTGPGSVKTVTALVKDSLLKQYYAFQHTERPVASQALAVGRHQGWLIGTQLRYKRPGVQATGELMLVAVIDTGRDVPAVAFASVPNTHRKLWPDARRFMTQLRPATATP